MAVSRNSTLIKNELIRYISSLGLTVNTVTKARGNNGFFKTNRIDISKNLDDDSAIRVIIHEFAHYVHFKLDNTLSDLKILFGEDSEIIKSELIKVTNFVDSNSVCSILTVTKESLNKEIKTLTSQIREVYPEFSTTEDFKQFKKYSRLSDIKYLEKYDRVKVHGLSQSKIYSIDTLRSDFKGVPDEFVQYLELKSKLRKRMKITRKINKFNKYYSSNCELFARFIEGMYLELDRVKALSPHSFKLFESLYNKNHYKGLNEVFSVVRIII